MGLHITLCRLIDELDTVVSKEELAELDLVETEETNNDVKEEK